MSVEDARRDVRDDVAQHIEDELWASGTWLEQRLDRLILEVRAEMPCYRGLCAHEICEINGEHCAACTARLELQKVAEAV